jgi:hypothetical protein
VPTYLAGQETSITAPEVQRLLVLSKPMRVAQQRSTEGRIDWASWVFTGKPEYFAQGRKIQKRLARDRIFLTLGHALSEALTKDGGQVTTYGERHAAPLITCWDPTGRDGRLGSSVGTICYFGRFL